MNVQGKSDPDTSRNPQAAPMNVVSLKPGVVFDMRNARLIIDQKPVDLEPRLAGVLAVLVQKNGDAVGRDELIETVWDDDVSDHALTQAISRLRMIFGADAIIETVSRIGYKLHSPPERLDGPLAFGSGVVQRRRFLARIGRPVFRTPLIWIAGLIVIAAVLAAPFYFAALPPSVQSLVCGACLEF
jgi:DNA-binding winged helix-turn-helix (wHTH) protein